MIARLSARVGKDTLVGEGSSAEVVSLADLLT